MHAFAFYVLVMFAIGAAYSFRLGLVFAALSAMAGGVALGQFHVSAFEHFLVQLGVFVAACALWLLVATLLPRRPRPARVSATHHSSDGGPEAAGTVGPALLVCLVFFAIVAGFFAVLFLGPPIDESVVQLIMITGIVGVVAIAAFLARILVPLLSLITWASSRRSRRE